MHATSIWSAGYESFRENVEVKAWDESCLGKPLDLGLLGPAKGWGRLSIIYFAVIRSYAELKNSWDGDTENEFKRPTSCKKSIDPDLGNENMKPFWNKLVPNYFCRS